MGLSTEMLIENGAKTVKSKLNLEIYSKVNMTIPC